jgi:uncharacterized membrane protein YuzA (DUF378 family)
MWKDDRKRTQVYLGVCITLLVIAVAAPLATGVFDLFRPESETIGEWFGRSGAITTVFSLLVVSTLNEGLRNLWIPGQLADLEKIAVHEQYKPRFNWCENIALVLTIIGTIIWGYGDLLL